MCKLGVKCDVAIIATDLVKNHGPLTSSTTASLPMFASTCIHVTLILTAHMKTFCHIPI